MMQRTRWILYLILALCAAPVLAQWGGAQTGTLQGTVRLADGTPIGGIGVTVTGGGKTINLVTTSAGKFTTVVPMGRVTASIAGLVKDPGATQTVIVAMGGTSNVSLVLGVSGVLLTVATLDRMPINVQVKAAYHGRREDKAGLDGQTLGTSGFWLGGIPDTATEMAALATVTLGRDRTATFAQQWAFDRPQTQRALRMVLPIARVRFQVVDAFGMPLRNVRLSGSLTSPAQQTPPDYWEDGKPAAGDVTTDVDAVTDANGVVDLGLGMVGDYRVSLGARHVMGRDVRFSVMADGRSSMVQYVLTPDFSPAPPPAQERAVQQLVFGDDARPAAHAEVFASYAYRGHADVLRAVTDDNGWVTWGHLPPVRVIVWGNRVPAGVIPAQATMVRDPLPAPRAERDEVYRFSLDGVGDERARVRWFFRTPGQAQAGEMGSVYIPGPNGQRPYGDNQEYRITSGTRFSLGALTDQAPSRVGLMPDVYAPYLDDGARAATFTLALQEGALLQGRLVTAHGQPVGAISRLGIERVAAGPDFFSALGLDRAQYERVTQYADGRFSVALLMSGAYRFLVDLYDESTPPAPELTVDLKPGANQMRIELPEPLLRVPRGTQVQWLHRYDPGTIRTFKAGDAQATMPVFGSGDYVVAAWYQPDANRLVVWDAVTGRERALLARTVNLLPMSGHTDLPYDGQVRLRPLLPVTPTRDSGAHPETESIILDGQGPHRVTLWPGRYMIDTSDEGSLGWVDVPQAGPRDIKFYVDPGPLGPGARMQEVRLTFPRGDYDAMRRDGSDMVLVTADGYTTSLDARDLATGAMLVVALPEAARTLTIQWLGTGVIRDVRIPPASAGRPRIDIDLPRWEQGLRLTGRVLREDGSAAGNARLQVRWPGRRGDLLAVTDEEGYFTLDGLLPGALNVALHEADADYTWTIGVADHWGQHATLRADAAARRHGPLALYLPLDPRNGLPGAVTLTSRTDRDLPPLTFSAPTWVPGTLLDIVTATFDGVPAGDYSISVDTPAGQGTATVTVTEYGGAADVAVH